jgi:hypothetical protein
MLSPFTLCVVAPVELSGVSIVGAGTFNPAIIHPLWLVEKQLIPSAAADDAMSQEQQQKLIVTADFSVFVADWLSVQVTQNQAVFSTVEAARELDLRDLVHGVFDQLPETPIDGLGINADAHFQTGSEDQWHAFGDKFLPKQFWEEAFENGTWQKRSDGTRVGMRSMTVEVQRADGSISGFVRVEVAPSVRITPNGVYAGINAHFQLTAGDKRGNAAHAAEILVEQWDATRAVENRIIAHLQKAI